jgi:hypothetical protein
VTGLDGGAVIAFRLLWAVVLFGQPGQHPHGDRRVEGRDLFGLDACLVRAATHEAGSLDVELRQVGAGLHVGAIQLHRALELPPDTSYHAGGGEEIGVLGLQAVGAAQPHMVVAVAGL